MAENATEDPGEIGPVQRLVRGKMKSLGRIDEMLRQAHQEKAAGRIEELHEERARRIREIKKVLKGDD